MVRGRDKLDPEDFLQTAFARIGYRRHIDQKLAEVKRLYRGPNRHFHNWDHILEGILFLIEHSAVLEYEFGIAYLYHDAVYVPGAPDNELRSAYLCYKDLVDGGVPQRSAWHKFILIMATAHDRDLSNASAKEQEMSDVDLLPLAKPWDEFERRSQLIRKEFSHVPDEDFWKGRKNFFAHMLARPHIFYTRYCRDEFEEQAQNNLRRFVEA